MAQNWYDADGLFHQYGTDKAIPEIAGEYRNNMGRRCIEVKLDLTTLTSTPAIISNTTFFPKTRIEQIDVETVTAATSSGSATLDFGLQQTDRATEIDYNGFIAALAKTAYDAAGETTLINVGSTGAGALIGTTTTNVGYLTANYTTAAYTAGIVILRIWYNVP